MGDGVPFVEEWLAVTAEENVFVGDARDVDRERLCATDGDLLRDMDSLGLFGMTDGDAEYVTDGTADGDFLVTDGVLVVDGVCDRLLDGELVVVADSPSRVNVA